MESLWPERGRVRTAYVTFSSRRSAPSCVVRCPCSRFAWNSSSRPAPLTPGSTYPSTCRRRPCASARPAAAATPGPFSRRVRAMSRRAAPTAPTSLQRMHYSKKYHNSPMPHSIFFRGGYAIHGTGAVSQLGRPASHGCIRLAPGNAARLFQMVKAEGASIHISGSPPASRNVQHPRPRRRNRPFMPPRRRKRSSTPRVAPRPRTTTATRRNSAA